MERKYKGDLYKGFVINGKIPHNWGKFKFQDGSTYKGEINLGMFHGFGKLQWPDGSYYEGNFENHKKCGKGIHRLANRDIYEGEWSGEWAMVGTKKTKGGIVQTGELKSWNRWCIY